MSLERLSFAAFLERMRNPAASDVVRAIKAFLTDFASLPPDAERDSARVQHFLSTTEATFRAHPLWRGASEEELEASGEGLEKYLLTKLHGRTFAVVEEDVEKDRVRPPPAAARRSLRRLRDAHLLAAARST